MRTSIDIDAELLREAMRLTGARTKKAAVEAGLRLLVAIHAQQAIRRLKGKVRWEGANAAAVLEKTMLLPKGKRARTQ